MRTYFARRGVVVPAAIIGSMLAAHAVHAAPVQLVSTLAASAASGAGLGFATSFQLFKAMILTKLKFYAAGVGVSALCIVGGAVALVQIPAASVPATNDLPKAAFVLRGRLQKPDGKPVAGAKIHVATIGGMVRLYYLTNSVPTNARISKTWTTSAVDGAFAIGLPVTPPQGKAVVAVNDDAGY